MLALNRLAVNSCLLGGGGQGRLLPSNGIGGVRDSGSLATEESVIRGQRSLLLIDWAGQRLLLLMD